MSERSAVQAPMIKYADQLGWRYVGREDALKLRGGDTGLYFAGVLRDQILKLNPGVVNAERADAIIRELTLLNTTIEGNRDALAWMRGERSVYVPEEKRERNVTLIDFANPGNNVLQVTDEWRQRSLVATNRADVVFLVNGIPVAVAETKNAGKPGGLEEAIDQIRRYHRETPALFLAAQVFQVTQLFDFLYGATWAPSRKDIFNWKDVVAGDYERKVKDFFDPRRFLRLLRDYIRFLSKDDVLAKVILRQHQIRAAEKVLARVQDGEKRRALIWHTQGSGKTLTMLTIAAQLLTRPYGEKPLVLMIVDRNELEGQLDKNLKAYGMGEYKVAASKADLQKLLREDYRSLVVSMVHKFEGIPADVNPRRSVVVLVDEAHRTTGGDLGNYLMGALPNATYIGFTGTPIDRLHKGQGTFKVFGPDDPEGYLDKYSIAESIADGTTVRLNYSLAPSDLRVDRETLEREFLNLAEAEGMTDIEELNAVLDRAVQLKEIMKAPQRVERIAAFVAGHFRNTILPMGFKAFLVAVDREACALYKRELDKYLPADWTEVVYSPAHNDDATLKQYYLSEDQEKKVRKDFAAKDKLPKLLIVTEKLLTGFDAPILYCMYLDKPMRDHVLLQAIARVNRPYEDDDGLKKPCGFVLDFVGIFEKLEAALAFDSDIVGSVIENVDVLKQLFAKWMGEEAPKYLPLTRGWDDKAKERAVAHFEDKATREAFYTFFRQLQGLYDVLSPDAFLRPYLEDYRALGELYEMVRYYYTDHIPTDKELTAKTRKLLGQHAASTAPELPGAIHELGPRELAALKDSTLNDTVTVLNLRKILQVTVDKEGKSQPFLLSIGERAEALTAAYEDRHLTTQQALTEFEKLAQEYVEADAERERLGLDGNAYAVYKSLQQHAKSLTPAQADAVNAVFAQFPDYRWNDQQARDLRNALYKTVLPIVGQDTMIEAVNSLLKLERV